MEHSKEPCELMQDIINDLEMNILKIGSAPDDLLKFAEEFMPFNAGHDRHMSHAETELLENMTPSSEELFHSRLARIRDVNRAVNELIRIQNNNREPTDEEMLALGDSLPSDLSKRVRRAYELIHYVHCLQEIAQKIRMVMQASYNPSNDDENVTNMASTRFFRKEEFDKTKLTTGQLFTLHALEKLALKQLRRYKSMCYEAIYSEGHYTYAWKCVCDIKTFIWKELIQKDTKFDQWFNSTSSKGTIEATTTYLNSCYDSEFPTLKKNRKIISFSNGVLISATKQQGLWKSNFFKYTSPGDDRILKDITMDGSVASVYHNRSYPEDDIAELNNILNAHPTSKLPRHIIDELLNLFRRVVPNAMKIIDHQGWPPEARLWLLIMTGRMMHPIGGPDKLDNWHVAPFLYGLGQTGKSTWISDIVAKFFESEDVAYFANNMQKTFSWINCRGAYMWLAPELKDDFALHCDQAQWQQAISGETFTCSEKHEKDYKFDPFHAPGMMAGNTDLGFKDNAESLLRRRVDFYFGQPVEAVDLDLPLRLEVEVPAVVALTSDLYLHFANYVHGKIWASLPQYFTDLQKEHAEETNPLVHFLSHGPLEYGSDAYIQVVDFCRLFKIHCKDHDLQVRAFRKEIYAAPFKKAGICVTKKGPSDSKQAQWIKGCREKPIENTAC